MLSDVDRARLHAEAAERQQERDRQRAEQYAITAENIAAHLSVMPPATDSRPYLQRKDVSPFGVFENTSGRIVLPSDDPNGQVWSQPRAEHKPGWAETVGARWQADRRFPSVKAAARWSQACTDLRRLCAGATLHEATGLPVLITLSSNNLLAVAEACRMKFPDAALVIAGDNDHLREHQVGQNGKPRGNPGRIAAEQAAEAVTGVVFLPSWDRLERFCGSARIVRHPAPPR